MKTILICGAFRDYLSIIKNSRFMIDNAANSFSQKLIKGFKHNINSDLIVINCSFIGSYPKYYKKIYYKSVGDIHNNIYDISFINIFLIRNMFRYFGIRKCLRKILAKYRNEEVNIIAYSLHSPFLFALIFAKKINKNVKTCIIIADLPEMMNLGIKKNIIKDTLKIIDTKIIYRILNKIDYYILLTPHMIDYLKLPKEKCDVIEGIASEDELTNNISIFKYEKNIIKKAFMYAGTLNYIYGIMDLLEGFLKLEYNDIELWICGNGEAEIDIQRIASIDERIKYFGNLDYQRLKNLYSRCYALINPRSASGEYVKYSFPSKIIEYLSTGKPTIAYYLPGIPEEYKEFIFEIKENGKEGIYLALKKFLEMRYEDCINIAYRAKKYILENKIERIQTERILTLMKKER